MPFQPVCCRHSGRWWNHPRLWRVRPYSILCSTQNHAIHPVCLLLFRLSVKSSRLITSKVFTCTPCQPDQYAAAIKAVREIIQDCDIYGSSLHYAKPFYFNQCVASTQAVTGVIQDLGHVRSSFTLLSSHASLTSMLLPFRLSEIIQDCNR